MAHPKISRLAHRDEKGTLPPKWSAPRSTAHAGDVRLGWRTHGQAPTAGRRRSERRVQRILTGREATRGPELLQLLHFVQSGPESFVRAGELVAADMPAQDRVVASMVDVEIGSPRNLLQHAPQERPQVAACAFCARLCPLGLPDPLRLVGFISRPRHAQIDSDALDTEHPFGDSPADPTIPGTRPHRPPSGGTPDAQRMTLH